MVGRENLIEAGGALLLDGSLPEFVTEGLKEGAPTLGLGGDQALIRAYLSNGLRKHLGEREAVRVRESAGRVYCKLLAAVRGSVSLELCLMGSIWGLIKAETTKERNEQMFSFLFVVVSQNGSGYLGILPRRET